MDIIAGSCATNIGAARWWPPDLSHHNTATRTRRTGTARAALAGGPYARHFTGPSRFGGVALYGALEMEALGVSLIVLGLASFFSGLIFMLPTGWIIHSSPEQSHEERQQQAEHSLEQMRKESGEL